MSYNPNIPQANDLISDSQAQIQQNFFQINNQYGTSGDHVPFSPVSGDAGKHKKSSYINGADPVTAINEVALYAKQVAGVSQLFMRRESAGTVIQLSKTDPIIASSGSTYLPGGIIMKWGKFQGVGAGFNDFNVLFTNSAGGTQTAFPTGCFSVVVSVSQTAITAGVKDGSLTSTGFNILKSSTSQAVTVFYIAIGN